jgi:hypothetical protein
MSVNRGKKFEDVIRSAFEKVSNVSVVRLHDQTTGYLGSSNHCDFIVYRKPFEYHIECKSVHGNTLSIHSIPKTDKHGVLHGFYGNITDTQWEGLLEKSKIEGVTAGVICWWIDKDVTLFIPIELLVDARKFGYKSIRYDFNLSKVIMGNDLKVGKCVQPIAILGMKKRVFFDYDMEGFLDEFSVNRD